MKAVAFSEMPLERRIVQPATKVAGFLLHKHVHDHGFLTHCNRNLRTILHQKITPFGFNIGFNEVFINQMRLMHPDKIFR